MARNALRIPNPTYWKRQRRDMRTLVSASETKGRRGRKKKKRNRKRKCEQGSAVLRSRKRRDYSGLHLLKERTPSRFIA
jgi:hypothetical protein